MKGRMIVLDQWNGREAAALIQDGRLEDLLIDDDSAPRPGAIFRAVCDRPVKGQGGMFVRLPDGESGYLKTAKGMKSGDVLLVQVTGIAEDGKAVPVTDRVLFKSRYVIVTPNAPGINISRQIDDEERREELLALVDTALLPQGAGLIMRSNCWEADDEDIQMDIDAMTDLAGKVLADAAGDKPEALTDGDGPHDLAWREWNAESILGEDDAFATVGIDDQIRALSNPLVDLGEATMYIETTRALVAIDVNTAGDTSPAAALKANMAASRALARQLRLRGLGGQIVVDFAPMSKAQRQPLEQSLRSVFRADAVETSLVGWTAMGLFELSRKRERLPLARLLKGA